MRLCVRLCVCVCASVHNGGRVRKRMHRSAAADTYGRLHTARMSTVVCAERERDDARLVHVVHVRVRRERRVPAACDGTFRKGFRMDLATSSDAGRSGKRAGPRGFAASATPRLLCGTRLTHAQSGGEPRTAAPHRTGMTDGIARTTATHAAAPINSAVAPINSTAAPIHSTVAPPSVRSV